MVAGQWSPVHASLKSSFRVPEATSGDQGMEARQRCDKDMVSDYA
jgi:hypothetical protein